MTRKREWIGAGVLLILGAVVAFYTLGGRFRIGSKAVGPRADWLVGQWKWTSNNPDVNLVETFGNDGQWTLSAEGFTPSTPTEARWKTLESHQPRHVIVLFPEKCMALVKKLRRTPDRGEAFLSSLLRHRSVGVKVLAAIYLLSVNPRRAVPVLKQAAKGKGPMAADALMSLERWRDGDEFLV
jgi:hypothetical protein